MNKIIACLIVFFCCANLFSQNELVQINKDSRIDTLLKLKKEIKKNTFNLKIQIFSGERDKALELIENHDESGYINTGIELVYETPNYKVRVGKFKNLIDASKNLEKIKRIFRGAFILKNEEL